MVREGHYRKGNKMLKNDPPIGTKVKFNRDISTAKKDDFAKIVRPLRKHPVENPGDEYEVEFLGKFIIVQRRDIEIAN